MPTQVKFFFLSLLKMIFFLVRRLAFYLLVIELQFCFLFFLQDHLVFI